MNNNSPERVARLLMERLQEEIGSEVVVLQPEETKTSFLVASPDAAVMVDASDHSFRPVNRGRSTDYLRMKRFLKDVGLSLKAV